MPRNILFAPQEGIVCVLLAQGLAQWGLGFSQLRRHCFLWFVLAIAPFRLLSASEIERTKVQIRYFNAIAQIDFVGVYGWLNDLLW